jgi:superfamily II DNA or RNA helicase
MIVVRSYQEKALELLGVSGEEVLSICPGGGKTFTAIAYANKYKHLFKKVLVLAHATNVLKSQWEDVFKALETEYSTDVNSGARFILTIPQALTKKQKQKFDLLIVDEAHEFYFAAMVQDIKKQINPKCTLLLTGTPSKFIKADFKPVIVSGCEIFNDPQGKEYLSNTYFGMVKSNYKLDINDFDGDGETVNYKFTNKDTQASLESLVEEMINRLSNNDIFKKSPNIAHTLNHLKLNRFQKAFGGFGKTLIAARNIAHAKILKDALDKKGINVLLSESDSDVYSENIELFKKDDKVQVLVVVKRGILGFDMARLINVVDFSMCRNIDRIYQLYARVLRVHPDGKNKFFFKICSGINPQIDSIYFQAALCLNNPSFISKYNGKNLKSLPILTRKTNKKPKKNGKPGSPGSKSIDGDMFDQVIDLKLMSELVINSDSELWKEFEYTTVNAAISRLTGVNFDINYSNIDTFFNSLKERGAVL